MGVRKIWRLLVDKVITYPKGLFVTLTIEDVKNLYIQNVNDRLRHQDERLGQACFNALSMLDPEVADMVRGTACDPFYKDHRVTVFELLVWNEVIFGKDYSEFVSEES